MLALARLAHVPIRQAVGTSLLVIALDGVSGVAGYLGTVDLGWGFLAEFAGAAVAGALAGTALSARVPQGALRRNFAVLLPATGGFVLYENRGAFGGASTIPASVAARAATR